MLPGCDAASVPALYRHTSIGLNVVPQSRMTRSSGVPSRNSSWARTSAGDTYWLAAMSWRRAMPSLSVLAGVSPPGDRARNSSIQRCRAPTSMWIRALRCSSESSSCGPSWKKARCGSGQRTGSSPGGAAAVAGAAAVTLGGASLAAAPPVVGGAAAVAAPAASAAVTRRTGLAIRQRADSRDSRANQWRALTASSIAWQVPRARPRAQLRSPAPLAASLAPARPAATMPWRLYAASTTQHADPHLGSRGFGPGLRAAHQEGAAPGPQRQELSRHGAGRRQRLDRRQGLGGQPGAARAVRPAPLHRLQGDGQELPRAAAADDRRLPRGDRRRPPAPFRRSAARAVHARGHRRSMEETPQPAGAGGRAAGVAAAGGRDAGGVRRGAARAPGRQVDAPRLPRRPARARGVDGGAGGRGLQALPRSRSRPDAARGAVPRSRQAARAGRDARQRLHAGRAVGGPRRAGPRSAARALRGDPRLPRRPAPAARAPGAVPPGP